MLTLSKKFFIVIAGILLLSSSVYAQGDSIPVRDDHQAVKKPSTEAAHIVDLGLGFGMDYGGMFGVQLGVTALKHLTFFASGGYYKFQGGWNVGLKTLMVAKTSEHAGRPYLKVMYGCNSALVVEGADEYNKVYKGWTVGLGIEIRFGKNKQTGFNMDLNVPLRSGDFWADWNNVKQISGIQVKQEPLPIGFSIGFHHEF
jgi:hypothetical protein